MDRETELMDLTARKAAIIREMEILSTFRGGGPDPAAVARMKADIADLDAQIEALRRGAILRTR
jgi:hypothetical protein